MRKVALANVLKVWIYAAATVLLGTWLSPLLYNAGKALAEVSAAKQTNGPLEWVAGLCRAADFPAFFVASLLMAALFFFHPLMRWLGGRWSLSQFGVQKNPRWLRQAALGFAAWVLLFLVMAEALILTRQWLWISPGAAAGNILMWGFFGALALAIMQEWVFRGIVLGIFLRALRPAAAIGLSAALFALVHFLVPPLGMGVVDADAAGVGWELLRKVTAQFCDARVLVVSFAPLLALGAVLAYARWRTASLGLSIGLHAGWIFIHGIVGSMTAVANQSHWVGGLMVGSSLKQGWIPLAAILIAGIGFIRRSCTENVSKPTS
jgi:membrane protease YdiL (CAAX protease family)